MSNIATSERRWQAAMVLVPTAVVALVGFYRVTASWWFHDDWVFLADAAGIADRGSDILRFVSYKLYWNLMYGVWGLNPVPYAVSRILVHITCGFLVVGVARKLKFSIGAQALAGVVFVSSPVAFESLYWGTGIVEQLGTVFGLAAVYVLLGRNRWGIGVAFALCVLSVFSKESSFFVPFMWAYFAYRKLNQRWLVIVGLLALVIALVVSFGQTSVDLVGSGDYLFSLAESPRNFTVMGFWLFAPAPLLRGLELHSSATATMGALLWALWLMVALRARRSGDSLPLVLLVFSILPLLPAVGIGDHAVPRYLYGSLVGWALSIVWLLSEITKSIKVGPAILLTGVVALVSWSATAYRIDGRWSTGVPIHRLVVKQELSARVFSILKDAKDYDSSRLVFVVPEDSEDVSLELLEAAIGGSLGVNLVLGVEYSVKFVSAVSQLERGSAVVEVRGLRDMRIGYFK